MGKRLASEPDARLTTLFESHYDEVLAYCTRRIGLSDADDIAAEVFATAWRRYDDIDWETVRPWLYGIARGVISNRWRSSKRKARLVQKMAGHAPPRVDSPEVFIVRRVQDLEVHAALKSLRPNDREIILLAAWEELTAAEIGAALGISTSAAEQRLHRAKKRLEKVLKPSVIDTISDPATEGGIP